jgi:hypothetical protein
METLVLRARSEKISFAVNESHGANTLSFLEANDKGQNSDDTRQGDVKVNSKPVVFVKFYNTIQ